MDEEHFIFDTQQIVPDLKVVESAAQTTTFQQQYSGLCIRLHPIYLRPGRPVRRSRDKPQLQLRVAAIVCLYVPFGNQVDRARYPTRRDKWHDC